MSESIKERWFMGVAASICVLAIGWTIYVVRWGGNMEASADGMRDSIKAHALNNQEAIRQNSAALNEVVRSLNNLHATIAKVDGVQQSNLRRIDNLEAAASENRNFREKYFQELERRLTTMEGTIRSSVEKMDQLLKRP